MWNACLSSARTLQEGSHVKNTLPITAVDTSLVSGSRRRCLNTRSSTNPSSCKHTQIGRPPTAAHRVVFKFRGRTRIPSHTTLLGCGAMRHRRAHARSRADLGRNGRTPLVPRSAAPPRRLAKQKSRRLPRCSCASWRACPPEEIQRNAPSEQAEVFTRTRCRHPPRRRASASLQSPRPQLQPFFWRPKAWGPAAGWFRSGR
mmetsp:Transcript_132423/g.423842  ORF Transcript_132423/g.423842 Transcript_132423/m.423842 type:complete len:202 (+) Transcript_132423:256-861(+)